ncbi:UNVERIFIED_CONTAM: LysR family transcriptional regulator, partial [Bacillus mycoides]
MIKLEVISIELRQLEYFLAVSKELHFTKAAEKLNISQPSLSQQIRALEHEVGMPLFDRIGKKISLTEAGRVLLSHSKTIFHEVEQARSAIQDLNGLHHGSLTIGSLLTVVNY